MVTNSEPNSPIFLKLFSKHWRAGTGLAVHDSRAMERDKCWSPQTFSNAMTWAGFPNTDPATIDDWRRGQRFPRQARKEAILKIFFRTPPGVQMDHDLRRLHDEMEQAWHAGPAERRTEMPPRGKDRESEPQKRWRPTGKYFAIAGLASLRLAEPLPGNELESGWFVKARLRVNPAEYEREDGTAVFIGIREALLTVTPRGYQVATLSLIGQQGEHPNFRSENNNDSIAVVGPASNGCLDGDPMGDHTVAKIVPTTESSDEEAVGITLHAFRRSFVVSLTRTPMECIGFEEKQAVLNLIVELGRARDAHGRVLLAHDSMRRVKTE